MVPPLRVRQFYTPTSISPSAQPSAPTVRARCNYCQKEADKSELKVFSVPVSRLVIMKLPDRLIPSQLIDISCTAYVKGNTSDHPRERQPLLAHPPPPSPLSSLKIQTLSWKNTHKHNRQRRDALRTDGGTRGAQEENLTSRLNAWMDSVCSTAVAVLDLANREPDYLLNHWYLSPFSLGSRMVVLRPTFFYQVFAYD